MCDKCRGRLGKAQFLLKDACIECLGGVIGNGEAAGDSDDVLGACPPEGLVDFSSDELVEDSVVHFLCWMLMSESWMVVTMMSVAGYQ